MKCAPGVLEYIGVVKISINAFESYTAGISTGQPMVLREVS